MKCGNRQSTHPAVLTSVLVIALLCALSVTACGRTTLRIEECHPADPHRDRCAQVGIIISFSETPDPIDADSLAITREVDPDLLSYAGGSATVTATITLTDGTTRSYSSDLVYNSSRSAAIAPYTPGFQVFAFVPADPSSLQSFIDQYRTQTTEVSIDTKVDLRDVATSSETTSIDAQETHEGSQSYLGTLGGVGVGDSGVFNQDP